MSRLSRVAFYAGWIGIAVLVVFVFLLLFRWVDLPSLAVILPFAIGYGALKVTWHKDGDKRVVVSTGDVPRGGASGRVARWFRDLIERGDAKLLYDTPAAPQARAPSANPADWVAEQIRLLKTGRMEIDAPKKGRVGREERVTVAIAKVEHDRIIASVAEARQLQAYAIKVNTFMRVELHGDAFEIKAPSIVDKLIADDQPALWEFRIVPKESGPQTLMVHAIVRIRLQGGGEEYYELEPQRRQIVVSVGPIQAVKRFVATPYVKVAVVAWTVIAATFTAIYSIDPLKDKINELLKPYVDWLFG